MQLRHQSLSGLLVLTLAGGSYGVLPAAPSQAAEWLAPAADERITAEWVRDVARQLRKDRFKNVFMNQPFGCDQCRIIHYLNNAAGALDSDQPKLAKSFVKRALHVLKDGKEEGWYTSADIRPIKRLIIQKANQAFKEAGGEQLAFSVPKKQRDERYDRGDDPLFSRSGEDEAYGVRTDRWAEYGGASGDRDDRRGRQAAREQDRRGDRGEDLPGHERDRVGLHDDSRGSEGARSRSQTAMQDDLREGEDFKRTVQKALRHARKANEAGKNGNHDELVQQSRKALSLAKQAQRAGNNERLNEGVYALGEAIEHGRNQETKDAREHVMHAIMKLSQSADMQIPEGAIPPSS
jgi:hypothetical protein